MTVSPPKSARSELAALCRKRGSPAKQLRQLPSESIWPAASAVVGSESGFGGLGFRT